MKKIFYSFLVIALVASSACKKDTVKVPPKAFEDITYQDIKDLYDEPGFTFQEIILKTPEGVDVLKPGSVILYSTSGIYGKLKIVNISAQNVLSFDMVNYSSTTGLLISFKNGATVQPSYFFNLVTGLEILNIDYDGFKYSFNNNIALLPFINTRMYVYSK
jgi:hypothetical protein